MMPNNFYSLVKEEPETINESDMDTNVLPPTSCGMQGHVVAGGVAPPHVVGAPMPPGLPLTPVTPTSMQPPHLKYLDIDPNFEPVARSRSNTWPLPRPEGYIDGEEPSMLPTGDMPTPTDPSRQLGMLGQPGEPAGGGPKKNTSRRNPWGNMSYADLIAQAILSSPDHRATLSQVYDWMVQNVPYFKDKGDSNSSAGWKVSGDRRGGSDPLHTMKVRNQPDDDWQKLTIQNGRFKEIGCLKDTRVYMGGPKNAPNFFIISLIGLILLPQLFVLGFF